MQYGSNCRLSLHQIIRDATFSNEDEFRLAIFVAFLKKWFRHSGDAFCSMNFCPESFMSSSSFNNTKTYDKAAQVFCFYF